MVVPRPALRFLPAAALLLALAARAEDERANFFGDPFVQATHGINECPVPEGPLVTRAQLQAEAHQRAERGASCFQSGRCRLPNAYLYDREIVPRVEKAIHAAGRFEATTSVWIEAQRRWVWLKGCVRTQGQADELAALARLIDDVEAVVVELKVLAP